MNKGILFEQEFQPAETTVLVDSCIEAIKDVKGESIVKLDLREVDDSPADYFVVCEAESTVRIKAISERIVKRNREEFGLRPSHIEGASGGRWILIDYFDVVVHIFYPETRSYYELEDLWQEAQITKLD